MATIEGESLEDFSEGQRTRLPVPLNSKRLTAVHLKRLVKALMVPTATASDEIRQMVEGKLEEQGHEAQNVQVILGITSHDVFFLQDEDGVFLRIETKEEALVEESHFPSEFQSADLQEELHKD